MNTANFRRYIALGDSISIDRYPALDYRAKMKMGYSMDEEDLPALGAASLFYQNNEEVWPDFQGQDLCTLFPGIEFENRTTDGATTWSVLSYQLPRLGEDKGEPTLVTLTIGGNDLLGLLGLREGEGVENLKMTINNLYDILHHIRQRVSHPTILIGTVYDPSDDTRNLGTRTFSEGEAELFHQYNQEIRDLCAKFDDCLLTDIYQHFLGHGITVPVEEWWYWAVWIIEPNLRGASEVRRLWLEAVRGF